MGGSYKNQDIIAALAGKEACLRDVVAFQALDSIWWSYLDLAVKSGRNRRRSQYQHRYDLQTTYAQITYA